MPFFPTFFLFVKNRTKKKQSPKKSLEGLLYLLSMSVFSVHRNDLDRMDQASLQQVAGDRQTGHHDAHHAHQLDENVQRWS